MNNGAVSADLEANSDDTLHVSLFNTSEYLVVLPCSSDLILNECRNGNYSTTYKLCKKCAALGIVVCLDVVSECVNISFA